MTTSKVPQLRVYSSVIKSRNMLQSSAIQNATKSAVDTVETSEAFHDLAEWTDELILLVVKCANFLFLCRGLLFSDSNN